MKRLKWFDVLYLVDGKGNEMHQLLRLWAVWQSMAYL